MTLSRRFRWAILLMILLAGVLVSPALLLNRPRHLTAEDMLQLREQMEEAVGETGQPMSCQDIEVRFGPPSLHDSKSNSSTWRGWSYSLQGRSEIVFFLKCDAEGRTLASGSFENQRTLWESVKDRLAEAWK